MGLIPRRRPAERDSADRENGRRGNGERRRASSNFRLRPAPASRATADPATVALVDRDPLYQITSRDGRFWLDPFSGTAVEVEQDWRSTALDHLTTQAARAGMRPLSLEQLQRARWRLDLGSWLPTEERLRCFDPQRGWLNPFSGEFHAEVALVNEQVGAPTVEAMAGVLATCPFAATGSMQPMAQLRALLEQQSGIDSGTRRQLEHLHDDLRKAQDVQSQMLPALPAIAGYDLGVFFEPHSRVSGDFYEVHPLQDGRWLIMLGDVSGHGMQAALVVASILKASRLLLRQSSDLVDLVGRLNDEIRRDLLPGQFVTLFAALFDPGGHRLEILLAGHHKPLLLSSQGDQIARQVGQTGVAVGLVTGKLFRDRLRPELIHLRPGDLLVQYSDGMIEVCDQQRREFGLSRFVAHVLLQAENSTDAALAALAQEVRRHGAGMVTDDLTALALRRLPEHGA